PNDSSIQLLLRVRGKVDGRRDRNHHGIPLNRESNLSDTDYRRCLQAPALLARSRDKHFPGLDSRRIYGRVHLGAFRPIGMGAPGQTVSVFFAASFVAQTRGPLLLVFIGAGVLMAAIGLLDQEGSTERPPSVRRPLE